ncbi:GNAT family N-acetyltransferase [Kocuria sp.]|uniref:GNAT family N-acetyltransferase n=1 Tax=Kocuria sp. TaxID=1871328 RepID=UPI0034D00A3E
MGKPWQGRDHATCAAQQLVRHLRAQGISHLVARIRPEHYASQAIARKLGMTPTDATVDGETQWET